MTHQPCANPLDLTIVIPTLNEAAVLPACLSSIGSDFAKYVVVVDSSSSDGTADIARQHSADLVNFQWNGFYPKKRNWFLLNCNVSTSWILFLDADEVLTIPFKAELRSLLPYSLHHAYKVNYTNYFLGKKLLGGYPLQKLALFRAGHALYEFVDERNWSACDMEVHEHLIVAGTTGCLLSSIDHHDQRGIDAYLRKHSEYASWEAQRILSQRASLQSGLPLSRKQRLKYAVISSNWGGLAFFLISFFVYGGWRDGSYGFLFALLKSSYFAQIACRLRELEAASLST